MSPDGFHDRPFDEGTLTKLHLFQLYTREWLPVFLSKLDPPWRELHVFDFFAGPGTDSTGVPGSPLRLLDELHRVRQLPGWPRMRIEAHFFDEDREKIDILREKVQSYSAKVPSVRLEVEPFRDHSAIKQRIQPPDDYYHVHRAVADYYRTLLPRASRYSLGRFSIKKGSNIYGVIFGSRHPLGMDKFLRAAWRADETNGEATSILTVTTPGRSFRTSCRPRKSAPLKTTWPLAYDQERSKTKLM